ncbi:MAG: transporter substrate-binding domain-containing protein [Desulfobacterales bacterium]|nr:transporter substrate-binding domain-containing protein [Desulfobacterales bacterium]
MEKFFKFFITVQFVNIVLFSASYASQTVKVGVYQNFPLCFTDEHGEVQGIYIDVLAHVAKNEGWKIEYTAKTWNECLEELKLRKIDLLCGIAYTEKRAENYFFNKENIIVDWDKSTFQKDQIFNQSLTFTAKKWLQWKKAYFCKP